MDPKLAQWAKDTIIWAGSTNTNQSDRRGYTPKIIVDHITEGNAASCIDWFTNAQNKVSSAHFVVAKDGKVYQFVPIENNAWANGLAQSEIQNSTSAIVKKENVNPNWYSVSIEHEGVYTETKGALTQSQLTSSAILHKYIIQYVKDKYGYIIEANNQNIIGHVAINPKGKPHCPGEAFPFNQIIDLINGTQQNSLFSDIAGHWGEKDIIEVVQKGLMQGLGNKVFNPDGTVTRAQLATVINKTLKLIQK